MKKYIKTKLTLEQAIGALRMLREGGDNPEMPRRFARMFKITERQARRFLSTEIAKHAMAEATPKSRERYEAKKLLSAVFGGRFEEDGPLPITQVGGTNIQ